MMKNCNIQCQSFCAGTKERYPDELQSEILQIGRLLRDIFFPTENYSRFSEPVPYLSRAG